MNWNLKVCLPPSTEKQKSNGHSNGHVMSVGQITSYSLSHSTKKSKTFQISCSWISPSQNTTNQKDIRKFFKQFETLIQIWIECLSDWVTFCSFILLWFSQCSSNYCEVNENQWEIGSEKYQTSLNWVQLRSCLKSCWWSPYRLYRAFVCRVSQSSQRICEAWQTRFCVQFLQNAYPQTNNHLKNTNKNSLNQREWLWLLWNFIGIERLLEEKKQPVRML